MIQLPQADDATMIYNADGQYAVVAAKDVPLALAAGWRAAPEGTLYAPPAPYPGTPDFAPEADEPKPAPKPPIKKG